jgi:hypothetical protein
VEPVLRQLEHHVGEEVLHEPGALRAGMHAEAARGVVIFGEAGAARLGTAGKARLGWARRGKARQAGRGLAWPGAARRGMDRHNTA